MKQWGEEPDGPVSPWLWLEAVAWGGAILATYAVVVHAVGADVAIAIASLFSFR